MMITNFETYDHSISITYFGTCEPISEVERVMVIMVEPCNFKQLFIIIAIIASWK